MERSIYRNAERMIDAFSENGIRRGFFPSFRLHRAFDGIGEPRGEGLTITFPFMDTVEIVEQFVFFWFVFAFILSPLLAVVK